MTNTTAIILGASGSVGKALLAEVVRSKQFSRVIVVCRRSMLAEIGSIPTVEECLVPDMQPTTLRQSVLAALHNGDSDAVGFSVLGVGAGTAHMSIAQHRAVDVELNAAFAAGLKESGRVHHLVFMSAIGADITASDTGSGAAGMPRYARVKGEAEHAVLHQGIEVVSIFRPSLIVGSQHTPWILSSAMSLVSPLIPTKYRPIQTVTIAQAMVAIALTPPIASAMYTYKEMTDLAASVT
jgi:uncharacterized protein YbjT (DUF2867 family)